MKIFLVLICVAVSCFGGIFLGMIFVNVFHLTAFLESYLLIVFCVAVLFLFFIPVIKSLLD